ncbi:p-hydroxycinnamoyl CoA hydratase/lyase [Fodinicola feengrottensis]|uniref:p-hydroxycinnamoyl CoA hydratase/lyase n=1 Tax=Fodinicola feengrottensis TaxID=435914 RepID=UPI002441F41F|nr:p-hydroxycinnamoyl CoA hydratase/lyase [Fodinicola feengrottensis]
MSNVLLECEGSIGWVVLNRPEKRNAMNPALNAEMLDVLDEVEADDSIEIMVLTGAGTAFSAGMDLKEYFHEIDSAPPARQRQVRREAYGWQYERLRMFPKPTIAMVNGWCFGGAFTPLVSCDLAIAAESATFGLSEVNWGIIPAGVVTRDLAAVLGYRTALDLIMTGRTFDGREAAAMGLVNSAVPAADLRAEVIALADRLRAKNPATLRAAKEALDLP